MARLLCCYAEDRSGKWEAVCLDLDIAVQGGSFEEVYADLHKAIGEYVDYVMALPEEERQQLLLRRAPFSLRFRFLWYAILISLFDRGRGGNNKERAEFMMPAVA